MIHTQFATEFKKARLISKLSLEDVAKAMDMDQAHIEKMELGLYKPKGSILKKLCSILNRKLK